MPTGLAEHSQDQSKAVAVGFELSRIALMVAGVDKRKDRKALQQWKESNCLVVAAGPGMYKQVGCVAAAAGTDAAAAGDSAGYEQRGPRRKNDHWLVKSADVSW